MNQMMLAIYEANPQAFAGNINYLKEGAILRIPADAELADRLREQEIGTRPFFWPMHRQPVFQRLGLFSGESYPYAESLAERGFYLPSGLGTSDTQIDTVAETLRGILS